MLSLIILLFTYWGRVSHWTQTYQLQLVWLVSLPQASLVSPPKYWIPGSYHTYIPGFYLSSENLNSSLPVCTQQALYLLSHPHSPISRSHSCVCPCSGSTLILESQRWTRPRLSSGTIARLLWHHDSSSWWLWGSSSLPTWTSCLWYASGCTCKGVYREE